jgi:hypothetical protein
MSAAVATVLKDECLKRILAMVGGIITDGARILMDAYCKLYDKLNEAFYEPREEMLDYEVYRLCQKVLENHEWFDVIINLDLSRILEHWIQTNGDQFWDLISTPCAIYYRAIARNSVNCLRVIIRQHPLCACDEEYLAIFLNEHQQRYLQPVRARRDVMELLRDTFKEPKLVEVLKSLE